ncbi:beta-1,3-glucan-binding protein-like [Hermetia illucens]|nr:beta-1,3-glucan-binding protein-like [Hermetia illucens]
MKSSVILFCCLVICSLGQSGYCRARKQTRTSTEDPIEEIKRDIAHPLVEGFSPRGLRVSIPDHPGIELFAFHGKINARLRPLEAGTMSKDILSSKNGRWSFEDKSAQLRVGDVVNYWIFVQVNGVGHRVDNLSSIITELPQADRKDDNFPSVSNVHPLAQPALYNEPEAEIAAGPVRNCPTPAVTTTTTTTTPAPPICEQCVCTEDQMEFLNAQLNFTKTQLSAANTKLGPIQRELSSLKEFVSEMMEDMNLGTKLLLVGQQPPQGNALEAVRNLITDKLELFDLEEKIYNAQKTDTGIAFEMTTPIDKKRILVRANKKLQSSNYRIVDPQSRDTIVNGAYMLDERVGLN